MQAKGNKGDFLKLCKMVILVFRMVDKRKLMCYNTFEIKNKGIIYAKQFRQK